jgi:hypothetical protein
VSSADSSLDAAWQAALAAEHQAVFGYSLLGPRLAGTDQQLAIACSDAHEALRDSTVDAIAAASLTPVTPQPDYPLLYPVTTAASARRLAARLEADCAAAWRFLYAQAATSAGPNAVRVAAQQALTASAVRTTRWRTIIDLATATTPFPGI